MIQKVEDYRPGEMLSLEITQLDNLPSSQQKKLVSRWCSLLPTLSEVKILAFHSRVTQEMFDAACAMPNLEQLFVKWSAITHLLSLPNGAETPAPSSWLLLQTPRNR